MSQQPDQHYIEQVLLGDTNAYSVLIDRYKYMVFTIAVRLIKNREDAEEVSQDVFIKAYKSLASFRGSAAFSTWLYKIAYTSVLDFIKKHRKTAEYSMVDIDTAYTLTASDDGQRLLEEPERNTLLKQSMAKLNAEDQVLLTLFYYEELSLKEIANVLGTSANTTKVRLFRSRDRLSRLMRKAMIDQNIE